MHLLSEAQAIVRLALLHEGDKHKRERSADCLKSSEEPIEEEACVFHDLQGAENRSAPILQAIPDFYTRYRLKRPSTLAEP